MANQERRNQYVVSDIPVYNFSGIKNAPADIQK